MLDVTALCFDSEGFGPISNKRILDFTICFENVVLLSIPKLLLLLIGISILICVDMLIEMMIELTNGLLGIGFFVKIHSKPKYDIWPTLPYYFKIGKY